MAIRRRNSSSFQKRQVDVFQHECRCRCCCCRSVSDVAVQLVQAAAAEVGDADEAKTRGQEVTTTKTWSFDALHDWRRCRTSTYNPSPAVLIDHTRSWMIKASYQHDSRRLWSIQCMYNVLWLEPPSHDWYRTHAILRLLWYSRQLVEQMTTTVYNYRRRLTRLNTVAEQLSGKLSAFCPTIGRKYFPRRSLLQQFAPRTTRRRCTPDSSIGGADVAACQ